MMNRRNKLTDKRSTEEETHGIQHIGIEKGNKEGARAGRDENTPIVSPQKWDAAHQQLLVKEKAFTRSCDALAAERRRMLWLAVDKKYEFEGPKGKASLLVCSRAAVN